MYCLFDEGMLVYLVEDYSTVEGLKSEYPRLKVRELPVIKNMKRKVLTVHRCRIKFDKDSDGKWVVVNINSDKRECLNFDNPTLKGRRVLRSSSRNMDLPFKAFVITVEGLNSRVVAGEIEDYKTETLKELNGG